MVKIKQDLKTALLNGGEWGTVEAEKKRKDCYFNKQFKHVGCIKKGSTCHAWRGRRSKALKNKNSQIEGKQFPGFPLKAMSHADIICCALT
jgi:hypothetical protein